MKKLITILLIFISAICNAQNKLDSTKILFDKDGNIITQKYYSMDKKLIEDAIKELKSMKSDNKMVYIKLPKRKTIIAAK